MDKQKIIIEGFLGGKSQWAIHRETGIDRKTIRKFMILAYYMNFLVFQKVLTMKNKRKN